MSPSVWTKTELVRTTIVVVTVSYLSLMELMTREKEWLLSRKIPSVKVAVVSVWTQFRQTRAGRIV